MHTTSLRVFLIRPRIRSHKSKDDLYFGGAVLAPLFLRSKKACLFRCLKATKKAVYAFQLAYMKTGVVVIEYSLYNNVSERDGKEKNEFISC